MHPGQGLQKDDQQERRQDRPEQLQDLKSGLVRDVPDRDELRQKLRSKIQSKRAGRGSSSTPAPQTQLKDDPKTFFLQMGIDDPSVLNAAAAFVKNPAMMQSLLSQLPSSEKKKMKKNETVIEEVVDADEEAPPE